MLVAPKPLQKTTKPTKNVVAAPLLVVNNEYYIALFFMHIYVEVTKPKLGNKALPMPRSSRS